MWRTSRPFGPHPDDEFRILASHPTEDGLLAILEVQTSDTEALVRDLAEASWLTSYELLHADRQILLVQYSLPFIVPLDTTVRMPPLGVLPCRQCSFREVH